VQSKRILIVDDEEGIRDTLRAFFEIQGFEVFDAADGVEASERIREEPFDVVLTDLRMPGLDGLGVLRLVRSISPKTAVLILTGFSSPQSESEAMKLGCDGFLTKPVRLDQLKSTIHQSLRRRRSQEVNLNTPL
jgi:DNA-binding response OmpR family regulator